MFKILDHIIKKRYDCSNYVDDEIENKELGPANMLDVLAQLQNQESCSSNHHGLHLTNNHLKAVTAEFLSAGTATVATSMEWALSELVENPRVMEKAQGAVRERFEGKTRIEEEDIENLSYLKLVVKESLRLHPPGVLLPREARETCEIGGYEITVQTSIIVNVWALSRDPRIVQNLMFLSRRGSWTLLLILRELIMNSYQLEPEEGTVQGYHLLPRTLSLHMLNCCINLTGAFFMEFDMSEDFGFVIKRKHNLELISTTDPFLPVQEIITKLYN